MRCGGTLWGDEPGSYVRRFLSEAADKRIVDLGAGDGKNAAWLAARGNTVVAVEASKLAVACARRRLSCLKLPPQAIEWHVHDVSRLRCIEGKFDAVIAYGLFHCLDDSSFERVLQWAGEVLYPGSRIVGAVLTDGINIPRDHGTGKLYLRPYGWYRSRISSMYNLIEFTVGTIEEDHPPIAPWHSHEVARFVAEVDL